MPRAAVTCPARVAGDWAGSTAPEGPAGSPGHAAPTCPSRSASASTAPGPTAAAATPAAAEGVSQQAHGGVPRRGRGQPAVDVPPSRGRGRTGRGGAGVRGAACPGLVGRAGPRRHGEPPVDWAGAGPDAASRADRDSSLAQQAPQGRGGGPGVRPPHAAGPEKHDRPGYLLCRGLTRRRGGSLRGGSDDRPGEGCDEGQRHGRKDAATGQDAACAAGARGAAGARRSGAERRSRPEEHLTRLRAGESAPGRRRGRPGCLPDRPRVPPPARPAVADGHDPPVPPAARPRGVAARARSTGWPTASALDRPPALPCGTRAAR